MSIDIIFLRRWISLFARALPDLKQRNSDGKKLRDIFRATCIKECELVLELSAKLLRKQLAECFASNRETPRRFKDPFRQACRHDLTSSDAVRRWLWYRGHRNDTTHEFGTEFAGKTVVLLSVFIEGAKSLATTIQRADRD